MHYAVCLTLLVFYLEALNGPILALQLSEMLRVDVLADGALLRQTIVSEAQPVTLRWYLSKPPVEPVLLKFTDVIGRQFVVGNPWIDRLIPNSGWSSGVTFTITPLNDLYADIERTVNVSIRLVSKDGNFDGHIPARQFSLTIRDDEVASMQTFSLVQPDALPPLGTAAVVSGDLAVLWGLTTSIAASVQAELRSAGFIDESSWWVSVQTVPAFAYATAISTRDVASAINQVVRARMVPCPSKLAEAGNMYCLRVGMTARNRASVVATISGVVEPWVTSKSETHTLKSASYELSFTPSTITFPANSLESALVLVTIEATSELLESVAADDLHCMVRHGAQAKAMKFKISDSAGAAPSFLRKNMSAWLYKPAGQSTWRQKSPNGADSQTALQQVSPQTFHGAFTTVLFLDSDFDALGLQLFVNGSRVTISAGPHPWTGSYSTGALINKVITRGSMMALTVDSAKTCRIYVDRILVAQETDCAPSGGTSVSIDAATTALEFARSIKFWNVSRSQADIGGLFLMRHQEVVADAPNRCDSPGVITISTQSVPESQYHGAVTKIPFIHIAADEATAITEVRLMTRMQTASTSPTLERKWSVYDRAARAIAPITFSTREGELSRPVSLEARIEYCLTASCSWSVIPHDFYIGCQEDLSWKPASAVVVPQLFELTLRSEFIRSNLKQLYYDLGFPDDSYVAPLQRKFHCAVGGLRPSMDPQLRFVSPAALEAVWPRYTATVTETDRWAMQLDFQDASRWTRVLQLANFGTIDCVASTSRPCRVPFLRQSPGYQPTSVKLTQTAIPIFSIRATVAVQGDAQSVVQLSTRNVVLDKAAAAGVLLTASFDWQQASTSPASPYSATIAVHPDDLKLFNQWGTYDRATRTVEYNPAMLPLRPRTVRIQHSGPPTCCVDSTPNLEFTTFFREEIGPSSFAGCPSGTGHKTSLTVMLSTPPAPGGTGCRAKLFLADGEFPFNYVNSTHHLLQTHLNFSAAEYPEETTVEIVSCDDRRVYSRQHHTQVMYQLTEHCVLAEAKSAAAATIQPGRLGSLYVVDNDILEWFADAISTLSTPLLDVLTPAYASTGVGKPFTRRVSELNLRLLNETSVVAFDQIQAGLRVATPPSTKVVSALVNGTSLDAADCSTCVFYTLKVVPTPRGQLDDQPPQMVITLGVNKTIASAEFLCAEGSTWAEALVAALTPFSSCRALYTAGQYEVVPGLKPATVPRASRCVTLQTELLAPAEFFSDISHTFYPMHQTWCLTGVFSPLLREQPKPIRGVVLEAANELMIYFDQPTNQGNIIGNTNVSCLASGIFDANTTTLLQLNQLPCHLRWENSSTLRVFLHRDANVLGMYDTLISVRLQDIVLLRGQLSVANLEAVTKPQRLHVVARAAPPIVLAAKFTSPRQFLIVFSKPAVAPTTCIELFSDAALLLGPVATCVWAAGRQRLDVSMSPGATLRPLAGIEKTICTFAVGRSQPTPNCNQFAFLVFKTLAVRSMRATIAFNDQPFSVQAPDSAPAGGPVLEYAAQANMCEHPIIDIRSSEFGRVFATAVVWSLDLQPAPSFDESAVAQLDQLRLEIRQFAANSSASLRGGSWFHGTRLLTIPTTLLLPNTVLVVAVEFTNFMGWSATKNLAIAVTNLPTPVVVTNQPSDGRSFFSVPVNQPLELTTTVQIPTCGNLAPVAGDTSLTWSLMGSTVDSTIADRKTEITNPTGTTVRSWTIKGGRSLRIPPYGLSLGGKYTFQVSMSVRGFATAGWASAVVQVASGGVSTLISGGALRLASSTRPITIDASSTEDYDRISSSLFQFQWTCQNLTSQLVAAQPAKCIDGTSGKELLLAPFMSPTGNQLRLPPGRASPGSMRFAVRATKGSPGKQIPDHYRTNQAYTDVQVIGGQVTSVLIHASTGETALAGSRVELRAIVSFDEGDSVSQAWWSCCQRQAADSSTCREAQVQEFFASPSMVNSTVAVVKRETLLAGVYVFSFSVHTMRGSQGHAATSVSIASTATPGYVSVNPTSGDALTTPFSLATADWSTKSATELSYRFLLCPDASSMYNRSASARNLVCSSVVDAGRCLVLSDFSPNKQVDHVFLPLPLNKTGAIIVSQARTAVGATSCSCSDGAGELAFVAVTSPASGGLTALSNAVTRYRAATIDKLTVANDAAGLVAAVHTLVQTVYSVDLCAGVSCSAGKVCVRGECQSFQRRLPTSDVCARCSGHGRCLLTPSRCTAGTPGCAEMCDCVAGWAGVDCAWPVGAATQLSTMVSRALNDLGAVINAVDDSAANLDRVFSVLLGALSDPGTLSTRTLRAVSSALRTAAARAVTARLRPTTSTYTKGANVMARILQGCAQLATDNSETVTVQQVNTAGQYLSDLMLLPAIPNENVVPIVSPGLQIEAQRYSTESTAAMTLIGSHSQVIVPRAFVNNSYSQLYDLCLHQWGFSLLAPQANSSEAALQTVSISITQTEGMFWQTDKVQGLDPTSPAEVQLVLPPGQSRRPAAYRCATWCDDTQRWHYRGLISLGITTRNGTTLLRCATSHFSHFSATVPVTRPAGLAVQPVINQLRLNQHFNPRNLTIIGYTVLCLACLIAFFLHQRRIDHNRRQYNETVSRAAFVATGRSEPMLTDRNEFSSLLHREGADTELAKLDSAYREYAEAMRQQRMQRQNAQLKSKWKSRATKVVTLVKQLARRRQRQRYPWEIKAAAASAPTRVVKVQAKTSASNLQPAASAPLSATRLQVQQLFSQAYTALQLSHSVLALVNGHAYRSALIVGSQRVLILATQLTIPAAAAAVAFGSADRSLNDLPWIILAILATMLATKESTIYIFRLLNGMQMIRASAAVQTWTTKRARHKRWRNVLQQVVHSSAPVSNAERGAAKAILKRFQHTKLHGLTVGSLMQMCLAIARQREVERVQQAQVAKQEADREALVAGAVRMNYDARFRTVFQLLESVEAKDSSPKPWQPQQEKSARTVARAVAAARKVHVGEADELESAAAALDTVKILSASIVQEKKSEQPKVMTVEDTAESILMSLATSGQHRSTVARVAERTLPMLRSDTEQQLLPGHQAREKHVTIGEKVTTKSDPQVVRRLADAVEAAAELQSYQPPPRRLAVESATRPTVHTTPSSPAHTTVDVVRPSASVTASGAFHVESTAIDVSDVRKWLTADSVAKYAHLMEWFERIAVGDYLGASHMVESKLSAVLEWCNERASTSAEDLRASQAPPNRERHQRRGEHFADPAQLHTCTSSSSSVTRDDDDTPRADVLTHKSVLVSAPAAPPPRTVLASRIAARMDVVAWFELQSGLYYAVAALVLSSTSSWSEVTAMWYCGALLITAVTAATLCSTASSTTRQAAAAVIGGSVAVVLDFGLFFAHGWTRSYNQPTNQIVLEVSCVVLGRLVVYMVGLLLETRAHLRAKRRMHATAERLMVRSLLASFEAHINDEARDRLVAIQRWQRGIAGRQRAWRRRVWLRFAAATTQRQWMQRCVAAAMLIGNISLAGATLLYGLKFSREASVAWLLTVGLCLLLSFVVVEPTLALTRAGLRAVDRRHVTCTSTTDAAIEN